MGHCILPLLLVLAVLGLDILTKAWAEQVLTRGTPVPVVGEVARLTLGYNSGMAFGLVAGAGQAWLLVVGPLTLGLAVWFVRVLRSPQAASVWPLGLLLGGALANLVDRWPDGRVTDVLDIGLGATRWPAFNLADASITLGVLGWLALSIREDRRRAGSRHK